MRTLQESVNQLQADVEIAVSEKESLRLLLADMTQQKESAVNEQKASEVRYQVAIAGKNKEIAVLKTNLIVMKQQVADREEEIQKLRGSFRELMKETVNLTAQRLFVKPVQFLGERTRQRQRRKRDEKSS